MKIIQSAKFKVQNYNSKFKIIILFLVLALLMLLQPINYNLQPAHAQTAACPVQATNPRVTEGLISASSISDNFSNPTGTCVEDPDKAPFVPYKIPSYDDLYSLYYTQSKAAKNTETPAAGTANQGTINSNLGAFSVLNINGSLQINGNITDTFLKPFIVFIRNDLSINRDIDFAHNSPDGGLVFVVRGNVNIDKDVRQIDAVIISEGAICTAFDGTACLNGSTITPQLIIYGSLISLNESAPIRFRRILSGTSNEDTAAEIINNEPKYLVILRNLMSDTLQKWSEIQ